MHVYAHINTYMNVYQCICMYMYVCDVYACILHVYACIFSCDPLKHGSLCQFPKTHSLWTAASGPHSGHPKASGHAFFSVVGDTFAHPILRTRGSPSARVQCPFCTPPGSAGQSPVPYLSIAIRSHGPSQQIWRARFHTASRKRRQLPLQNTFRQRFGGV